MTVTIWTDLDGAKTAADAFQNATEVTHLVLEREPAGRIENATARMVLGDAIADAEHRYTVVSEAEWLAAGGDTDQQTAVYRAGHRSLPDLGPFQ